MEDAPTISPKTKTTASGRSKEIKDMPVFIQLYGTHTQKNPIDELISIFSNLFSISESLSRIESRQIGHLSSYSNASLIHSLQNK